MIVPDNITDLQRFLTAVLFIIIIIIIIYLFIYLFIYFFFGGGGVNVCI